MRPGSLYISVLIFACAGCSNPSISRFDVTPPVLCDGEKAIVTWDAKGETALAVQEEASEVGASNCVASGQQTLALTLAAHSGSDEVERRVELVELQPNATEPIALRTNAIEATEVVASGDKNPALWHKSVEVATISACQNRPITVQHDGPSLPPQVTPNGESEKTETLLLLLLEVRRGERLHGLRVGAN